MRITIRKILAAFVVAALASSCSPEEKSVHYIPADAVAVVAYDIDRMLDKITGFQDVVNYATGNIDEEVDAFLNAGIELEIPAYLFVTMREDVIAPYAVLQMDNAVEFESYVTRVSKLTVEKDGKQSYITSPDSLFHIEWNEEIAVIVMGPSGSVGYQELAGRVFDQSKEGSLMSTSVRFSDLVNEDHDIASYIDMSRYSELMYGIMGQVASEIPIPSEEVRELNAQNPLLDAEMIGFMEFEDGNIHMEAHSYMSPEGMKMANAIYGGEMSEEVANRIPNAEIIAMASMHINVDEYLPQFETQLAEAMKMSGDSLDLGGLSAFEGDFIVGLEDLDINMMQQSINYFGVANSKDLALINTALRQFVDDSAMSLVDGFAPNGKVYLKAQDNLLAVGQDEGAVEELLKGSGGPNEEIAELMKGSCMTMYFNYDNIPQSLKSMAGMFAGAELLSEWPLRKILMKQVLEEDKTVLYLDMPTHKVDENSLFTWLTYLSMVGEKAPSL